MTVEDGGFISKLPPDAQEEFFRNVQVILTVGPQLKQTQSLGLAEFEMRPTDGDPVKSASFFRSNSRQLRELAQVELTLADAFDGAAAVLERHFEAE